MTSGGAPTSYLSTWDRQTAPGSLSGVLVPEIEYTKETEELDDLFANVRGKWQSIIELWRRNPLQCAVDDHFFYEFENIGQWKCAQHACSVEPPDDEHAEEYYPCCGQEGILAAGCVPADHRLHYAPYVQGASEVEMPSTVYMLMTKALGEPKMQHAKHNMVIVERFDRKEAHRRAVRAEMAARKTLAGSWLQG